jgi:hypothetical protein
MPLIDLKSDLTWYGKTAPGDSGPQDIISRGVTDTVRVTKYLTTPSGIKFLLKQAGLQLTNPNIENSLGYASINPKTTPTKQFTPINLLSNVATAGTGLRYSRHGISPIPTLGRYEDIVIKDRGSLEEQRNKNRLIRLKDELIDKTVIITPNDTLASKITSAVNKIQSKLGYSGKVIQTLSGVTGPKSILGVGTTSIFMAEKRNAASPAQKYTIETNYAGLISGFNSSITEKAPFAYKTLETQGTNLSKAKPSDTIPSLKHNIPNTNNGNEALQKYAAVAYNKIPKTQVHKNAFNNFILDQIDKKDLNGLLTGPILKSDYKQQNIVSQFNYKHYSSRVTQNMRDITFKKDIVKFQIGGIKFRAYIDSISDSFAPSFNNEQPIGSPFSAVRYQSIERSVSVSFKIAVLVREDLTETYNRMTQLQNLAYFSTGGQGFTAKTAQVVIGNLYNFTGIVESVSYDWDSEIPWEIEEGSQLPLYCNASVDFKYLIPKPGFNI